MISRELLNEVIYKKYISISTNSTFINEEIFMRRYK